MDNMTNAIDLAAVGNIKNLLLEYTGMKFEQSRQDILIRRLFKRINKIDKRNLSEYFVFLKNNIINGDRREINKLISELTVNETSFFRDEEHYEFIKDNVFPQIKSSAQINILSAGCSTGEEAYSLAIAVFEYFGISSEKVNITAWDVDPDVIAKSKNMKYLFKSRSLNNVNKYIIERYFDENNGYYSVRKFVKNKVKFICMNIVKDPIPVSNFDIIFCKNVLIYFNKKIKNEVIEKLNKSLKDGGYLFVSKTEVLENLPDKLLKVFHRTAGIFQNICNNEPKVSKNEIHTAVPKNVNNIFIQKIEGQIDDDINPKVYMKYLMDMNKLLELKNRKIIIDMSNVEYMSRKSIEKLPKIADHINNNNNSTAVFVISNAGLRNNIKRLEIDKSISYYNTISDAEEFLESGTNRSAALDEKTDNSVNTMIS